MKFFNLIEKKLIDESTIIRLKNYNHKYLVSIPHSGILIPKSVLNNIKIGSEILMGTDLYTEKVYGFNSGIKLVSKINPNILNMNRSKEVSSGNAPKHLQTSPLIPYADEEIKIIKPYSKIQKLDLYKYYNLYHNNIISCLKNLLNKNGFALMLDGHSLASVGLSYSPDPERKRADFILGTLNDTSAHPEIINIFYNALKDDTEKQGWTVVKNDPYRGGFITQKYHNLDNKINTMQLEINKATYMEEKTLTPINENIKIIQGIIKNAMDKAYKKAKEIYN